MVTYNEIINLLPEELINFVLVVLFSLIIGLEQRRHFVKSTMESIFGTDRTYTFFGILGFVLYIISPSTLIPFLGGGFLIGLLLAIFYYNKITLKNTYGITSIIVALITYCLAPIVYTQPAWFTILLVVSILVLVEMKEALFKFSESMNANEFITLAKFLVITGVILPLFPEQPISDVITISPYKFWLAIVAVSAISYLSYLLKKFVFPNSGIVLTGVLGGLYSSTASTFILARKSKELDEDYKISAAIILATTMMYIRIFILAILFNKAIAVILAPSFAIFTIVSALIAFYYLRLDKLNNQHPKIPYSIKSNANPLEIKTAFIFGILFIVFALLTGYVSTNYGTEGIKVLSFIVGVTDIDPFIINIFQGKWNIPNSVIAMAVINAVTSNNLLKMIYGISLAKKNIRKPLLFGFTILVVIGLITSIWYSRV
ncbi:MgtC/SapB family protein [Flavobacterium faecale]|uniref:MgtC/SapB family protein n=1 Tax=Flavobacterium faecale TaxID=1355330 RepID=UPI003AAA4E6A